MRTLDRYILREIGPPTLLGFSLFSFVLLMNYILRASDMLIRFGVDASEVLRFLFYSLPHIVVLTVPMAVLLGGLLAFGRMSTDFEIVALRSSGVSLFRLLLPVLFFAGMAWALNTYLFLVVLPWGNTQLRALQWRIVTSGLALTEEIQPRQFIEDLPNHLVYIREITNPGRQWQGVFIADTSTEPATITLAARASPRVDAQNRNTWLVLEDGVSYASQADAGVQVVRFDRTEILLLDESSNPTLGEIGKDDRSMNMSELWENIDRLEQNGEPANHLRVEVHKRYSLPVACLVLGMLALPLGISTQRHTRVSGFIISVAIILTYYLLIQNGELYAENGTLSPWLGMWWANLMFSAIAFVMLWKKAKELDWGLAERLRRLIGAGKQRLYTLAPRRRDTAFEPDNRLLHPAVRGRRWRFPRTLDAYVLRQYTGIYVLTLSAFVSVWLVFEYFDVAALAEVPELLPQYFKFRMIFILHMVIPIAALITVLAIFSLMTKHNEVIAALSGGISLQRLVLPLVLPAVLLTSAHYLLQDYVLPHASRRAEELKQQMRPGRARSLRQLQPWLYGAGERVFHFADYNAAVQTFRGLYVYYLDPEGIRLKRVEYSDRAVFHDDEWQGNNGWRRYFVSADGAAAVPVPGSLEEFVLTTLPIAERPEYFGGDQRSPDEMTAIELRRYIAVLEQRGFDSNNARVDFQLKVSFPAITLVLTLVAIPFAFRSGRHGALYGVGLALGLAVVFWIAFALFQAIGYAGILPPVLAAWAPHLLFLSLGGYLALGLQS